MASLRHSGLAAVLIAAGACRPSGPARATTAPAGAGDGARTVRVAAVREEPWERVLRVTGDLIAFEEATISAKVAGRLATLAVDVGSRVKRGEVLARVDPRDYELRVAQAEAATRAARARLGLDEPDGGDAVDFERTPLVLAAKAELKEARQEHERQAGLHRDGVVPKAALDTAESRLVSAESDLANAHEEVRNRSAILLQRRAELDLARQQLADAAIAAPFDGAVADRMAGTGDFLSAGDPVARLVRFDPLRLRMEVPELAAAAVRVGQTVRATLDGTVTVVEGRIARASPEIDLRNRTLRVEVELANPDGALRPGSFVRAEIVLDASARALAIPRDALVSFAGVDKAFVVAEGSVAERRVTLGRTEESRVEVLDGLTSGEEVVLSPGKLRGGERVRVER